MTKFYKLILFCILVFFTMQVGAVSVPVKSSAGKAKRTSILTRFNGLRSQQQSVKKPVVAVVVGSIQANSASLAVGKYVESLLLEKAHAEVKLIDLFELREKLKAESGKYFENAMTEMFKDVDSFLVVSPEYYGTNSGILTHFMNHIKNDGMGERYVGFIGDSAGLGGNFNGQKDFWSTYTHRGLSIVTNSIFTIPHVKDKIVDGKFLADEYIASNLEIVAQSIVEPVVKRRMVELTLPQSPVKKAKLAIISGSHRGEKSWSLKVAKNLQEMAEAKGAEVVIIDIGKENVNFSEIKQQIESCGALMIVSPEYSGMNPARLTELFQSNDIYFESKPVSLVGISGQRGNAGNRSGIHTLASEVVARMQGNVDGLAVTYIENVESFFNVDRLKSETDAQRDIIKRLNLSVDRILKQANIDLQVSEMIETN